MTLFADSIPAPEYRLDIGTVRGLKIDVLTETGWFDDAVMKDTMMAYGGPAASQYAVAWDRENAGGYAALITVTLADGDERRILLDTGWNTEWMDYVYARWGVDAMLTRGEIDMLVLSHWHLDHFWGIESALKHDPRLKILAPGTAYPEDLALLRERARHAATDHDGRTVHLCGNAVPHEGELVLTGPEGEDRSGVYRPFPGVAVKMFDVPILLRVRGENVLYFDVADRGLVTVTGCGHPGVPAMLGAARGLGDGRLYGCYGGLHLSVFETWKPEFEDLIREVRDLGMEKMGCNHCTGWLWAERAEREGLPIVKGTDRYRTYPKWSTAATGSHVFLANGDSVTF